MNYGNIKECDIADGPGVRVSLFVSGCRHHCKGCFNEETWNFNYGQPYTEETEAEILNSLDSNFIQGFTLLGGEPFEPENQVELVKLLVSPHPDYLRTAYETGITGEFLPEFDACMKTEQNTPHHCYTVGEHTLQSLLKVRADKALRLTMLLHDMGKPVVKKTDENGRDHFKLHGPESEQMAKKILRRLKFDNDTLYKVCRLVKWHDARPLPEMVSVRRAVNKIGEDIFPLYLEVQEADMLAQSTYRREEKKARLQGVRKCYEEILERKQCISLKSLAVTGRDLIAAGCKPGPGLGDILDEMLEHVLEYPEDNTKEKLMKFFEKN